MYKIPIPALKLRVDEEYYLFDPWAKPPNPPRKVVLKKAYYPIIAIVEDENGRRIRCSRDWLYDCDEIDEDAAVLHSNTT